ncbi:MAG: GAF domain-containing protein [Armatimonadota bacterium]|nr:GAF domain-containing protein [Armatimonadota bacterium]
MADRAQRWRLPFRPLARDERVRVWVVAGYAGVCAGVAVAVLRLGVPFSVVVLLAGPVLLASARFPQRVYLLLLPPAAAASLSAVLLRAPDLREALVAWGGLAVTVVVTSEALYRLVRSLRSAHEQLRRRAALLDALHTTTVGLIGGGPAEGLLENLLRRACELLETPHGNLFLVEGDRMRCRFALGATRWMQDEALEVPPGQGLAGYVWQTGRPVVVEDYTRWERRLQDPRLAFVRSAAAMPLRVHGQVTGAIVVVRSEPDRPFKREEVDVVERFAELVSLVAQNADLYRRTQEELARRRHAEADLRHKHELLRTVHATTEELLRGTDFDSLLAAIVHRATALLRSSHGNLYLREGDEMRCRVGVGAARWAQEAGVCLRRGEGMVGQVWETGQALMVDDYASWPGRLPFPQVSDLGPALTVPLRVGQEVVGAFFVARNRGEPSYSEDELDAAARFGHLASLVLNSASLYRAARDELERRSRAESELRRRHQLLEALQATSVALLGGAELQQTLDLVVRQACELLDCRHAALYLREGALLRCTVGVGILAQAATEGRTCEKGKGIVGAVWEKGAPVVVEQYPSWPGRQRRSGAAFDRLGPGLAVPLWWGTEYAGTLFLARDAGAAPFTAEEVDAAGRFAHAAALALHNAHLYQEAHEELTRRRDAEARLRRRQELLEALHDTAHGLLSGLGTGELLHAIVQRACQLLGSGHGNLYLVEDGVLRCRVGLGAMAWAGREGLQVRRGEGMVGRVWETGQPLVVEDYSRWPERLPDPRFDSLGSAVTVPLFASGHFVGAFSVARDRSAPAFTAEEIETVVRFGQLASLVLHHAQATQKVEEQRAFYEELLDHVPSDIAVLDPDFRYLYVNRSAVRDPELRRWVVGRDDFELCARVGQDRSVAEVRRHHYLQATAGRRTLEFEEEIRGRDGKARYFLRRVHPVVDREGRVVRVIGYGVNITDRKRAELRLAHLALHDALTGLPNRTLFLDRLGHALERARRTGRRVAVLFVDLDRFKLVNDTLGHDAGDRLLQQVAERLRSCLRGSDTLARLAGDEFTVLLEDVDGPDDALLVAQRVQAAFREPFHLAGQAVYTTASVGISLSGPQTQGAEDLLQQSDTAMYRAKALGRNRYQLFDEALGRAAALQAQLETDLRRALERGEFVLHYQPVVRIADRRVVEMEALVRWQHPQRGLLAPADFLSGLEASGLVPQLNAWVLREACRAARWWRDRVGDDAPAVSVNLAAADLADPSLPERLRAALQASGLEPKALRVEVPERVLTLLGSDGYERIRQLGEMDIALHVDDFAASSSLRVLRELPVRAVKLEQAWFANWRGDPPHGELLRAVVSTAGELGLDLVAKGVEDPACLERVVELGFPYAQGYALARPMDLREAERFLGLGEQGAGALPGTRSPAAGTSEPSRSGSG